MTIKVRLLRSIKQRKGNVVLPAELSGKGSPSQVTRALKALLDQGVIVRIGTGVYAKTRKSSVTGALIPAGSLESLVIETLKKLGVTVEAGCAANAYNTGRTMQLPGAFVVNTGRRRISRRISVGGRKMVYENNFDRAEADSGTQGTLGQK